MIKRLISWLKEKYHYCQNKDCWNCKHTSYYDLDENNFTLKCRRGYVLIKTVKWTGYCKHWRDKND